MTTYSPIARLPIMAPGDPAVANSWGGIINAALPLIEQLAAGNTNIDLTSAGVTYALTVANDAADQARQGLLAFTGTPGAPCTVTIPAIARFGWVSNATAFNVILTTGVGGGSNLTVAPGAAYLYSCDATNVAAVNLTPAGLLNAAAGLTVTGATNLTGPVSIAGATTITGATAISGLLGLTGPLTVAGTIAATGDITGPGTIPIGAGIDYFGQTPPPGWYFANGQMLSRTTFAALFAVIGTAYGAGDGSTTFNLPDKRARISLPLDNLGGAAANRVTVFPATTLGAAGGDQNLQAHSHGVSDPGHNHTISYADPGHVHATAVGDPGHSHGVTDPSHSHTLPGAVLGAAPGLQGSSANIGYVGFNTNPAVTNVSVNAAATRITVGIYAALTGITVSAVPALTGLTVLGAGAGGAQNMPPVLVCNYIIYAGA